MASPMDIPPQVNRMPDVWFQKHNPQVNEVISKPISAWAVFSGTQETLHFTWKIPSSVGLSESHSGESRNWRGKI